MFHSWSIYILLSCVTVTFSNLIRIPCHRTSINYSRRKQLMENRGHVFSGKNNVIREYLINQANFYWIGAIAIGTPGKVFYVDFDTGSTDLWVPSNLCLNTCENKEKYNPSASSTTRANGANFQIKYGDGSYVQGVFVNDTIRIGGVAVQNQPFAQARNTSEFEFYSFDGVLGLAYPSIGSAGQIPLFYNMWQQQLIPSPTFSFYFNPNPSIYPGGELILGGIDSEKYSGSITYVSVILRAYWEFLINNVMINNEVICSQCQAILDTGTTLIIGPKRQIEQLNRQIDAIYDSKSELYSVECYTRPLSSFPNVNISIGNLTLTLSVLQYLLIVNVESGFMCYTVFQGMDVYDPNGNLIWILGSYFLSRFYSVYDVQKHRVGLAKSVSYDYRPMLPSVLFNNSSQNLFLSVPLILFINLLQFC